MIKRIIFDVDNTLVEWKDKYVNYINRALDRLHYPYDENLVKTINDVTFNYDKVNNIYNKERMLAQINEKLNRPLPDNFMDILLEEGANDIDIDEEIIDAVKYLAGKYEIVALTNWFAEAQSKRLEAAGLLKYIKEVYGADSFLIKPNKEGFLKAMGSYQPSECVMIGDSIRCDIEPAHKLGIPTIYYDYKNKKDGNDYSTINKFKQLKDIL
jgi:putative hydrolase of the HAD superfamily